MTLEDAKTTPQGTPIVATYGFNTVTKRPFKQLYEFGYLGGTGKIIVYRQGERSMQDTSAFNPECIRLADENDLNDLFWDI